MKIPEELAEAITAEIIKIGRLVELKIDSSRIFQLIDERAAELKDAEVFENMEIKPRHLKKHKYLLKRLTVVVGIFKYVLVRYLHEKNFLVPTRLHSYEPDPKSWETFAKAAKKLLALTGFTTPVEILAAGWKYTENKQNPTEVQGILKFQVGNKKYEQTIKVSKRFLVEPTLVDILQPILKDLGINGKFYFVESYPENEGFYLFSESAKTANLLNFCLKLQPFSFHPLGEFNKLVIEEEEKLSPSQEALNKAVINILRKTLATLQI